MQEGLRVLQKRQEARVSFLNLCGWWQSFSESSNYCWLRSLELHKNMCLLGCRFYSLPGWRVSDSRVHWLPAQKDFQGLPGVEILRRRMLREASCASGDISSWILLKWEGLLGRWCVMRGAKICFPQILHHLRPYATGPKGTKPDSTLDSTFFFTALTPGGSSQ